MDIEEIYDELENNDITIITLLTLIFSILSIIGKESDDV